MPQFKSLTTVEWPTLIKSKFTSGQSKPFWTIPIIFDMDNSKIQLKKYIFDVCPKLLVWPKNLKKDGTNGFCFFLLHHSMIVQPWNKDSDLLLTFPLYIGQLYCQCHCSVQRLNKRLVERTILYCYNKNKPDLFGSHLLGSPVDKDVLLYYFMSEIVIPFINMASLK